MPISLYNEDQDREEQGAEEGLSVTMKACILQWEIQERQRGRGRQRRDWVKTEMEMEIRNYYCCCSMACRLQKEKESGERREWEGGGYSWSSMA